MSTDDLCGHVVILFGNAPEGDACMLARCPLGAAEWFPTWDEARRYADSVPPAFEPHVLLVQKGPGRSDIDAGQPPNRAAEPTIVSLANKMPLRHFDGSIRTSRDRAR